MIDNVPRPIGGHVANVFFPTSRPNPPAGAATPTLPAPLRPASPRPHPHPTGQGGHTEQPGAPGVPWWARFFPLPPVIPPDLLHFPPRRRPPNRRRLVQPGQRPPGGLPR